MLSCTVVSALVSSDFLLVLSKEELLHAACDGSLYVAAWDNTHTLLWDTKSKSKLIIFCLVLAVPEWSHLLAHWCLCFKTCGSAISVVKMLTFMHLCTMQLQIKTQSS